MYRRSTRLLGAVCVLLLGAPSGALALTAFDEGYALTWSDGSQGMSVPSVTASQYGFGAYSGSKVAYADYSPGGEFRLLKGGTASLSGKNVLTFAVYRDGNNPLTGDLTAQLYDANLQGFGAVSILQYLPDNPMQPNVWYLVHIPFTALNVDEYDEVRAIGFHSDAGLVYAWDAVKLEYIEGYEPPPPPPPPPPTETVNTVFDDVLGSGWEDWSWSATLFSTDDPVYTGSHALGVAYTAAWGGLYLHHAAFSTTGYETLRFALYGPGGGGQTPIVALIDGAGTVIAELPVTSYVAGNSIAGGVWYQVVIPLADLNEANTTVTGLMVQSPVGLVGLYLDDIMLSDHAGTSYSEGGTEDPPPPAATSAVVYDDTLGQGWGDWSWSTSIDPSSPVRYSGQYGLGVTYTTPWAGLQLGTSSFDTTGHNTLAFMLNGGATGGQELYVRLYDANGAALTQQPLATYVVGGVITPYVWHEVRIPLTALNGTSRVITAVELMSASATTVTLDSLHFDSFTNNDTGVCND